MQVILMETVEALGLAGTEVKVAPGYARNFLFPRQKAMAATPANRRRMEQMRARIELQIAREREAAQEAAKKLEGVTCRISAKVSNEGRLYGSVTVGDIVDALAAQDITVSKKMVLLRENIKEVGTYPVGIYLYKGVVPEIPVEVVADEKAE
ncbi:MAG: 50S ribosomal protein L9 [Thermodesulfobacteriota bacterium]|nr:50S ribosomal protein L9 [Thermodesulfobacteriota bacterium]